MRVLNSLSCKTWNYNDSFIKRKQRPKGWVVWRWSPYIKNPCSLSSDHGLCESTEVHFPFVTPSPGKSLWMLSEMNNLSVFYFEKFPFNPSDENLVHISVKIFSVKTLTETKRVCSIGEASACRTKDREFESTIGGWLKLALCVNVPLLCFADAGYVSMENTPSLG